MNRELLYDEVFDAQSHYRILLDSMARPGKINLLPAKEINPPAGINPSSVLVGFALLNADCSFYAGHEEIRHYLNLNTSGRSVSPALADYIFISGNQDSPCIREARIGSLSYPEEGATLIADVDSLESQPEPGSVELRLQGPGTRGAIKVYVTGLSISLLDTLKEQNAEFPLGIDWILTDKKDRILCVPRSNRFSYARE